MFAHFDSPNEGVLSTIKGNYFYFQQLFKNKKSKLFFNKKAFFNKKKSMLLYLHTNSSLYQERTHTIACDTVFASNSPDCLAQCIDNVQECNLSAPRIIACYEIVEQKARMKRKVDALRTAIGNSFSKSISSLMKVVMIGIFCSNFEMQ